MRITGTVRGTRSGFAFLVRDDGGDDALIPARALGGAIHGDRVSATLRRDHPQDFRASAHVEEILERPSPVFTGDVFRLARTFFVRPDSPLLPEKLRLRLDDRPAVAGEKILFRVENSRRRDHAPFAVFQEVLGEEGDARLDPIVIASEFGLSIRFPDAAIEEANASVARTGFPEDRRREDFRDQFVLTIDPIDAKDFDDAVALERRDDGSFRLTVHIADVSAYVAEGGALDREARTRGTSVYFPGSVFPMLPEAISSVAASLSPEEDKRTLSVEILLSPRGEQRAARIVRGWIRSSARLHYDQAQAILDGKEGAPEPLARTLARMHELASILRARRFEEGGFDLDVPEAEIQLGADGVPVRIGRRRHEPSHWLIEEFMIAANRAVGGWARDQEIPFLYRVHEPPDPASLEEFATLVRTLRPSTPEKDLETLPGLRRFLHRLPATPLGRVIHRYFLRSLKTAVYDPEDLGHFGLGIEGYSHFTSPIRRYPDLYNHRRIKERIDRRRGRDQTGPETARLSTRAESAAEEAEREMTRLKGARFMDRRLGKEAAGHVTGLTARGLFVELDRIPVEGFVPREQLGARAEFADERLAWVEPRSGWELRPGDPVRVQVARVDLRRRSVEFALLDGGRVRRPARRREADRPREAKAAKPRRGSRARGGRKRGDRGGRPRGHPRGGRRGNGRRRR